MVLWFPGQAENDEHLAIANRVASALVVNATPKESDFATPLNGASLDALSVLSRCRVSRVGRMTLPHPKRRNLRVEIENQVFVRLDCDGVPSTTPAGLTFTFENNKVKQVTTHSLDLIRQN